MKAVSERGADYVISDVLNFRGEARCRFMEFLASYDPSLVPTYEKLYLADYCDKDYSKKTRERTSELIKKYEVDNYQKMLSYRKKTKSQAF